MKRTGKIARLPSHIRSKLNRRLDNNEPAKDILLWLDSEPDVQRVLEAQFGGALISQQNLSEWRKGGFAEWQMTRDLVEQARDLADLAGEMNGLGRAEPLLVDNLAVVLSARFAELLNQCPAQPNKKWEAKVRLLNQMTRSVVQLQRGIHRSMSAMRDTNKYLEDSTRSRVNALIDAPSGVEALARKHGGGLRGEHIARMAYSAEHSISWDDMDKMCGSFDDLIKAYQSKKKNRTDDDEPEDEDEEDGENEPDDEEEDHDNEDQEEDDQEEEQDDSEEEEGTDVRSDHGENKTEPGTA